jgi:hypothetical protein
MNRIRMIVTTLALFTCVVGAAAASSSAAMVPAECADSMVFGSGCTAETAMSVCQQHYSSCDIVCASCSSLGNFNCNTSSEQCEG